MLFLRCALPVGPEQTNKGDENMTVQTRNENGKIIAIVESETPILTSGQSALDFIANTRYETNSDRIALNKSGVEEAFFDLSTGIAGEVLQKFINYHAKLAIYGDFSMYKSRALKDFIYESNNGRDIFFARDVEEALRYLAAAN